MTWDEQAQTREEAKRAVWAEDDYSLGIARCLAMLSPLTERLRDGQRVLDIGCGIGRLTIPLARRFPECEFVGLDPSSTMLVWATADTDVKNVSWVQGDVRRMNELATFDAIYSVVTFQHLPARDQGAYIRAMASVMGTGAVGRFQVVTSGDEGPLSHPVDPGDVRRVCEAWGLRVVAVDSDPVFPTWAWFTVERT